MDGGTLGPASLNVTSSSQGSTVKLTATGFAGVNLVIDGLDVDGDVILKDTGSGQYYKVTNFPYGDGSYSASPYTSNNSAANVVCFLTGTLITTPNGDRPIESLEFGDEVLTSSGVQQIKFISRSTSTIFHLMDLGKLPICIQAGSLGEAPNQDLWLSPSHAVLVMDKLVEASSLLNGTTIIQPEDPGEIVVTYYNIEFENHEIIRANGLEVESYYANWRGDGYSRVDWDNYDDYIALYGESKGMK